MDGTIRLPSLSPCLRRIAGGRAWANDRSSETENGLRGWCVGITTAGGPRIAKHRGSAETTAEANDGDRQIPLFAVKGRRDTKSTGDGVRNVIAGFAHGDTEAVDDLDI
jgi:hypothetical protein